MGTVPDLYQCPANDLDKFITDHLQPNKEFVTSVRAAVDTICEFLREHCFRGSLSGIKVLKVVKGGSSAKGTALKEGSDADLVVFLNCVQSYSHQESKRKEIIAEIREKLEECKRQERFDVIVETSKWDNPRVLSFRLRSRRVAEFIDFDVLPAYNALGQRTSGYKATPEMYVDLIKNWTPGQNFSPCFTELQRDFIVSRPTKVKSLIRLVKHWYKTKLEGASKLPPKYALELLSIYAWEKGEGGGQERFTMAQTFRNFLELICNYQDLCVYWTDNYNLVENKELARFLRMQLAKPRPVILDPADPTGNLGDGYNWSLVAMEAEKCLSQMSIKTSTVVTWFRGLEMMLLNVKFLTGDIYSLEVDPSIPISTLKAQVASKTGVPTYQQKLGVQNGGYVELRDTARLSEYRLSPGDTVLLVVKDDMAFEVLLMTDKGRKSTYTIKTSEGVSEFKERVQRQERVQGSQFWLCYDSKTLEDGRKLGEYNIVPGGTIYMNLRLRGG